MMKNIELNDLFVHDRFHEAIQLGLTKDNIERLLKVRLKKPDIETLDLTLYYVELKTGLALSLLFDKGDVCYEINLNLGENKDAHLFVRKGEVIEEINEDIAFDRLLTIMHKLNIEWEFDRKRVYLQTVCIVLSSGLRLYYSFGSKKQNDYGLFSIKLIKENHELTAISSL